MKRFSSLDEIWDGAIAKEIEAHNFYKKLAEWAERPEVVKAFEDFSVEEWRHKMRLEALRTGEVAMQEEEVGNLGIADSLETATAKVPKEGRKGRCVHNPDSGAGHVYTRRR